MSGGSVAMFNRMGIYTEEDMQDKINSLKEMPQSNTADGEVGIGDNDSPLSLDNSQNPEVIVCKGGEGQSNNHLKNSDEGTQGSESHTSEITSPTDIKNMKLLEKAAAIVLTEDEKLLKELAKK